VSKKKDEIVKEPKVKSVEKPKDPPKGKKQKKAADKRKK
jgi:hypothetical protein